MQSGQDAGMLSLFSASVRTHNKIWFLISLQSCFSCNKY